MMEGDGGRHEPTRISTVIDGVPTLLAFREWQGGRFDGQDLSDDLCRRPIYGKVPIDTRRVMSGVVERRQDYLSLGLWLEQLTMVTGERGGRYVPLGITRWHSSGEEEAYDELANEALAMWARKAKPTNSHIVFGASEVGGLYGEIVGWSVTVEGIARYGLLCPYTWDGVRMIGLECPLSIPRRDSHIMLADGHRVKARRWSFGKE